MVYLKGPYRVPQPSSSSLHTASTRQAGGVRQRGDLRWPAVVPPHQWPPRRTKQQPRARLRPGWSWLMLPASPQACPRGGVGHSGRQHCDQRVPIFWVQLGVAGGCHQRAARRRGTSEEPAAGAASCRLSGVQPAGGSGQGALPAGTAGRVAASPGLRAGSPEHQHGSASLKQAAGDRPNQRQERLRQGGGDKGGHEASALRSPCKVPRHCTAPSDAVAAHVVAQGSPPWSPAATHVSVEAGAGVSKAVDDEGVLPRAWRQRTRRRR